MSAYRAALLALFVVGGALVTAVPANGTPLHGVDADRTSATGDSLAQRPTDERVRATGSQPMAAQNESQNNSSLGADISSFMQSSAAEVGGAVETGMWTAAYNGTDNRTMRVQLVERQTNSLRSELAELRERKAELVSDRNATNVSDAAFRAKLGQLVGRINALQAAINATAVRARETNTNVAAVTALQSEAENLTGPEIAAVARNTTGVGLGNGERGPPDNVGNANGNGNVNGNGVAGEGNETTGPPGDVGNGTSNASQRGPPAHANAPMVGNGSDGATMAVANGSGAPTTPNASTPATPPVTVDDATTVSDGGDSTGSEVLSTAAGAASDLADPVSDALAVRTYALSHVSDVSASP